MFIRFAFRKILKENEEFWIVFENLLFLDLKKASLSSVWNYL
jgi:hypothetical protein